MKYKKILACLPNIMKYTIEMSLNENQIFWMNSESLDASSFSACCSSALMREVSLLGFRFWSIEFTWL